MPKNTAQRIIDSARGVAGGGSIVYMTGGGGGTGGVTDHGALTGLLDDDHTQYHNDTRGDARYVPLARQIATGDGLTGGGALSADRTLSLAASVAGAALSYNAGVLAVVPGEGLEIETDAIGLKASVAGNGLAYAAGVLNVGVSGLGLGVGADAVTLTSSDDPGAAASILATSAAGLLKLYNGMFTQAAQSAATFASGFAGSGWRADYGITTAARASMETDDLTVRGRMRVYELLIQQIRATNGSLFVSSASKVVSVTTSTNPLWTVNGSQLTFNGSNATLSTTLYTITTAAAGDTSRELYHGFLVGDLIRAQQVQWNGSAFAGVIQSNLEVTKVTNLYTYQGTLVSGDAAAVGYDYVRLGNSVDSSRQGSIYLTSDDAAAPFIDIVDGITSHALWNSAGAIKVRVGKLTGISDAAFGGPLDGYGIYASRAFIKGKIVVTAGSDLGGLAAADVNANTTTIDGGKITVNTILANRINTNTLAAIVADLGAVTAGSIVVGSGNKLWLNDSADGTLRIGGATKAAAPFQVSAGGHLDAIDATFGTMLVDSSGAYVDATSAWDITAGYRFKQGGVNAGGLTSRYTGSLAYTALLNNLTSEGGTAVSSAVDTGLYLQTAAASGKTAQLVMSAIRGTTTVGITLDNTGSLSRVTLRADTLQQLHSDTNTYDLWTTKNAGLISAYSKLAATNTFTNTNRFSGLLYLGGQVSVETGIAFNRTGFQQCILKFNSHASAPSDSNLGDGEFMIYAINGGSGSYELRWRGRRSAGVFAGGILATV